MIPIKNASEIDKMRQACRSASDILHKVSDLIRPGISTKEVDEAAADFMSDAGVKSAFLGYRLGHRVFPGNICISLNDEVVHGIGSHRRIQYGDIVKLDIGIVQDGWVGDNATTVPVGIIDERTDQLLRVTENALTRAIGVAQEGRRVGDICAEIEDEARRSGFSVVREFVGHGVGRKMHEEPQIPLRVTENALTRAIGVAQEGRRVGDICAEIEDEARRSGFSVVREFVGHGVGRKMHEEPQIPNYGKRGSGPKLKAGMTLAIEPMINIGTSDVRLLDDGWTVCTADGRPSAHFEHTVLITRDEPEILTWRAKTQLS